MPFNIFQKKKNTKQTAEKGDRFVAPARGEHNERSLEAPKGETKTLKVMEAGSATKFHNVIVRPRITEKATFRSSDNVHTFDVSPRANKTQISLAINEIYKVKPKKIRIVSIPAKSTRNRRTGQRGVKSGGKKAYVYLKEGDSIQMV